MKKLLNFLEILRDKYKDEYLYNEDWENKSIDRVVSKEDKYEIAKIIIDEKVKLIYMAIMVEWTSPYSYIKQLKYTRK